MPKGSQKHGAEPQPLPEELLDRGIGVLEGPVNRVLERLWKSRIVLLPIGLSVKITTKTIAVLLGRPKVERRRDAR